MNRTAWQLLEVLPMLIYIVACIGCSAYFLHSFMVMYVEATLPYLEYAMVF